MKIFAITFGDRTGASARMRLLQYLPQFEAAGDTVVTVAKEKLKFSDWKKAAAADVIFVQESLIALRWAFVFKLLGKRIVFEWDDALYARAGRPMKGLTKWKVLRRLHGWLRAADVVTVPSDFLGDYSRKQGARRVEKIPMALPIPSGVPPRTTPRHSLVLGWLGSPSNSVYLAEAQKGLAAFVQKHPDTKIKIMCGQTPQLSIDFEYVPWQLEKEAEFLSGIDVGLLPLTADDFSRGKSPLKALQYATYGVPFVASAVGGAPDELAAELGAVAVEQVGDWAAAIEKITQESDYAARSQKGWERVRECHDKQKVFEQLREILKRRN